jgi:hypothetical protein
MSDLFRRTAWALALASSLFVAACDDDDDDDDINTPSPITSPTPSPSPSPTPEPSPTASPAPGAGQTASFVGVARQVNPGAGTLRVGGRRVDTDGNTVIKNLGGQALQLSQIQNGQTVRVRGRAFDDGSVLAEAITLQQ